MTKHTNINNAYIELMSAPIGIVTAMLWGNTSIDEGVDTLKAIKGLIKADKRLSTKEVSYILKYIEEHILIASIRDEKIRLNEWDKYFGLKAIGER